MKKTRILIIVESIAPVQGIASIRWTKFAKYLSRKPEFDISVLTNQKDYSGKNNEIKQYRYDSTTARDLEGVTVIHLPLSFRQRIVNRLFNSVSTRLSLARNSMLANQGSGKRKTVFHIRLLSSMQVLTDWLSGKALEVVPHDLQGRLSGFDCVISTFGPRWPHAIARKMKKNNADITWIADFRDPPVSSAKNDNPITHSYADKITLTADCVIGVSKGTIDNLNLSHGQHAETISNGFDTDDISTASGNGGDKFSLVYTGTLYADDTCLSDIRPLFIAIDELLQSGSIDRRDIEVLYAGSTSDLFLQAATAYPRVPARSLGLLTRSEALSLQNSSTAAVVCTWNTKYQRGVLTGKVFEYMRSCKPVIGLCSGDVPNSDLRKIIEDCHLGVCFEEADPRSYIRLKNAVLELYESWKQSGNVTLPLESEELVMRYSYPVLSSELAGLIQRLRDRP